MSLDPQLFIAPVDFDFYSTNLGFRTSVFTAPGVCNTSLARLIVLGLDPSQANQGAK